VDEHRPTGCRRLIISLTIIIMGIILCSVTLVLTTDSLCLADLAPRLPYYPNAAVVREQHSFLRLFGMGVSTVELTSADDVNTVTSWYARTVSAVLRDRAASGAQGQYGQAEWSVEAADGGGSRITLLGVCGT
jgi:hypothetical protein